MSPDFEILFWRLNELIWQLPKQNVFYWYAEGVWVEGWNKQQQKQV